MANPLRPPIERLERVEAWGMASASMGYVFRPTNVEGIREAFEAARASGKTVALRGAGNSYGDAFQNAEGVVLDLSRMNRVLDWNPETGVIRAEPGLTIQGLWRYVIEDGWWPPVVSGTSFVTLGGALSANIHGKNNWHSGPIGEHVLSFDLLTPGGETMKVKPGTPTRFASSPTSPSRGEVDAGVPADGLVLFHAVIGGLGLLGVITAVEIQLKKLHSGFVNVEAFSVANWAEAFEVFNERYERDDYLVGWIDCFAGGSGAGRGLIHAANYPQEGDDPHPEESLKVAAQELPDTAMGMLPRSKMHRFMAMLLNRGDMRMVNWAKHLAGKREAGKVFRQPIVEFNFLLDSAPNWKFAYKPGGLIQYQCFVPKAKALGVFEEITNLSRERGMPPFLGVMKRHRPDGFLLSHAVDGYSLALDYPVYEGKREALWQLCRDMTEMVLDAGGRFYFAKDSTLTSEAAKSYLGEDTIEKFMALKKRLDPENLLQTELSKRVFGPLLATPLESPVNEPSSKEEDTLEASVPMPEPFWGESPSSPESERTIETNLEVPE